MPMACCMRLVGSPPDSRRYVKDEHSFVTNTIYSKFSGRVLLKEKLPVGKVIVEVETVYAVARPAGALESDNESERRGRGQRRGAGLGPVGLHR